MKRRTHDRLRCDGCDRPALALHAYLAPFERTWLCRDCVRYAAEHGLTWRPVTVTTRLTSRRPPRPWWMFWRRDT